MMSKRPVIDRAALYASLRSDAAPRLAFGDAPAGVAGLEREPESGAEDAIELVAGLAANAAECAEGDPATHATCMLEAGRVLERRLSRPSEAWCCYSLACQPGLENADALRGLARIARAARDPAVLRRILARMLDEATDAEPIAALSAQKAALEIAAGDTGDAIDTLRAGLQRAPDAAPLRLMMLGLSLEGADGELLCETLDALAARWGGGLGAAMSGACAALEESLGRVDEARERLARIAQRGDAPQDVLWALARLALRAGDGVTASQRLAELRTRCDGDLGAALERILAAMRACSPPHERDDGAAGSRPDAAGSSWDLALVEAVRSRARAAEAEAARAGRRFVTSQSLAFGLEESERLAAPAVDAPVDAASVKCPSSRGAALWRFVAPDDREPDGALAAAYRTAPCPALHVALPRAQPEDAAQALAVLAEDPGTVAAAQEIAAARATVLRNALGRPDEALDVLSARSGSGAQPPLASLIRLHRRDPDALAAVALAEADAAATAEARSWCLSWAAHRLTSQDPSRAEALFREALELNPSCGIALHAVERLSGDHAAIARSWLAAHDSLSGDTPRLDALIKAGVHFALARDHAGAAEAFARGTEIAPRDLEIGLIALRLALAAGRAPAEGRDVALPDGVAIDDLSAIAATSLHVAPHVALRGFERLRDRLPGDPVVEAGLTEARLAGRRWSEVSGALLERLKAATTPEAEALVYARLAEIDRHFAADPTSASLSQSSIAQRLPGHRPTLASLAIHYARQDREADLADVLLDISRVVDDDLDGAAAAAASARLGTAPLQAARSLAARSPASVYAAAELEARAEDPRERLACLRRLAGATRAPGVHLSRLADALEDAGEAEEALTFRAQALERTPESLYDLHGVALRQREAGDSAGLLASVRRMAELTSYAERRKELLLEAARIAADGLGDLELASRIALDLLGRDPADGAAFELAAGLMASYPDLEFADAVLEARIGGIDDDVEKRSLLLEQAQVRERRADPAGAKASLSLAVAIFPSDFETRRELAALHVRDAEWPEAIAQMFEAARYVQDPAVGVDLFYELGALYQDHGDRADLAEKCFMKVLAWDRGHFGAMERLAAVYADLQNWPRRAQALEHLIGMTDDEAIKIEKTVALADVMDRHLGKAREAEQMLNDARRAAPLDVRPIERLAATYSRQHDSLALNVLLDQALATHSATIGERPGDAGLYGNLLAILSMKSEDDMAAMAESALSLLGAEIPERYATHRAEPWWNVGSRLGEGAVYDFLCPKEVTPGLRETLAAVEEPVAKLLGASAKHVAGSAFTRLDKRHPLAQTLAQYAPAFGVRGEPALFVGDLDEIRVAPGSPPAVIVPKPLAAATEDSTTRFTAAAALGLCQMGLGLGTMLPAEQLNLLIACCVKIAVPGFDLRGVDPAAIAREVERLRPALSNKLIERIHPFAFDCAAALEGAHLRESVRSAGHRAGFIAAGTFSAAVAALRILSGRTDAPMGEVPGMGGLAAFVFSKVHLELRQRMGI